MVKVATYPYMKDLLKAYSEKKEFKKAVNNLIKRKQLKVTPYNILLVLENWINSQDGYEIDDIHTTKFGD